MGGGQQRLEGNSKETDEHLNVEAKEREREGTSVGGEPG